MNLYRVGYIFSILSSDVIVMTEDLEFYKIRRRSDMIEIGQEISFSEDEIIPVKSRKPNLLRFGVIASGLAAAIVLIFIGFFTNFTNTSNEIYAYIDVDTNLSVRLNIDKENKVVDIDSQNTTTKEILNNSDFKNKSLSDALTTIVEKSKQHGFTTDSSDEYLLISASIKSDGGNSEEQDSLENLVQNVYRDIEEIDNLNVNKRIIKVDFEICKIATANNVSMGRYITYIESKNRGANLSIEDIREGSIGGIMKKADLADITNINGNNSKDIDTNKNTDKSVALNQDTNKTIENPLPKSNDNNNSRKQSQNNNKGTATQVRNTPVPKHTPNPTKNTPIIFTFKLPTPTLFIPTYNPTKFYPVATPAVTVHNTPIVTVHNTPIVTVYNTPTPANNWPVYVGTYVPQPINTPTNVPKTPTPTYPQIPIPTFNFTSPVEIAINRASNITQTSAFISGAVTKFEYKDFYGVGCNITLFYWEASNPMHVKVAASINKNDFPADISATIYDLKPNTTYQFKVTVNYYFNSRIETFNTLPLEIPKSIPTPTEAVKYNPTPTKNMWVFPTPAIPDYWWNTQPQVYMPQYTFAKPTDLYTPVHTNMPPPTPTRNSMYHPF